MPAVAYPSPGGLSFLQLTDLIAGIAAKARIGGFAMVEFVQEVRDCALVVGFVLFRFLIRKITWRIDK